jgi:hypothetical protein
MSKSNFFFLGVTLVHPFHPHLFRGLLTSKGTYLVALPSQANNQDSLVALETLISCWVKKPSSHENYYSILKDSVSPRQI